MSTDHQNSGEIVILDEIRYTVSLCNYIRNNSIFRLWPKCQSISALRPLFQNPHTAILVYYILMKPCEFGDQTISLS